MTNYSTEALSPFEQRLVALARAIMDAVAPDLPNRPWFEDSLFRTMQTAAATRQGEPDEAVIEACERIGRIKAQTHATLVPEVF